MEFQATSQVDTLLASYEAAPLIIWITVGVIIVALIALGTEFWVNLWGVIFSPSLTFQRLLGEAQWAPALVIAAIAGLASAAIALSFFSDQALMEKVLDQIDPASNAQVAQLSDQLDNLFNQIGSDFTVTGNLEWIKEFTFQLRTIAVAMPLIFLIVWGLWGLAGQLASMIAGNKAGHGLSNLYSTVPYLFLLGILSTWLYMLSLKGHGWANAFGWLVDLYFMFLHVVMMREHGRYTIGKAIVATILTLILIPIFAAVLAVAIAFITVQAGNYL